MRTIVLLAALLLLSGTNLSTSSPETIPFGSKEDVAFANDVWRAMVADHLVGDGTEISEPFFGGAKPHGEYLEIASRQITVGDHIGDIVIKKNYDGTDITAEAVSANRKKFLASINVMFRREAGYDEDNQNWFWVKYRPDGTLFSTNINGQEIDQAGRISKGKSPGENRGCLFCHRSAGGGDYIFYPRIFFSDPP